MTAIILAGGKNRRMGTNKAFLNFSGKLFLEHQIGLLTEIFDKIIISANFPDEYKKFNLPVIADVYPDKGPLGGIYTGLINSNSFYTFIVACDMPFIETRLIRRLADYTMQKSEKYDVILPQNGKRLEPLHAFYSKNCVKPIKEQIENNNLRIIDFFPQVNVKKVEISDIVASDKSKNPLINLNTMEEYKMETLNHYRKEI